ncbi:transforming acidic coiled-coil-containing protein 2 isoform X5 [Ascaphus truei]|uniref:transforming acidic coiled-coil-containing protein 2 isoform X5 n=1 Tax=Ascaphus truei TaxID=8439 RepID=UPI003F5A297C
MGNDNSTQSEAQEPIPVLVPQYDTDIKGTEQNREGGGDRVGETHSVSSLYPENPTVSAAEPSGDVSLQRGWEEGQLLPALPLADLYIADLEYKESGSSPNSGTISVPSNEGSKDDPAVSDEIGLSQLLREWGNQVLPEKIPEKSEQSLSELGDACDLQKQSTPGASPASWDTEDIKAATNASSNIDANKHALATGSGELELSIGLLSLPPQQTPEFSQLCPKNAGPTQPNELLGRPEDTFIEAEDSVTVHNAQQGLCSLSDIETLTTDGATTQTGSQDSLVLPYLTDGSSDRNRERISNANELVSSGYLGRGETTAASGSEHNLMVSENSGGPDTFSNKIVNSLANSQSVPQVGEAERLLQEQMDDYAGYHSFVKIESQETSPIKLISDSKRCSNDLEEKKTLIDSDDSGSTKQETTSHQDLKIKSRTKFGALNMKDKAKNKSMVQAAKGNVENRISSDGESSNSAQILRTNEETLCKLKSIDTNLSGISLDMTPPGSSLLYVNIQSIPDKKPLEDHGSSREDHSSSETVKPNLFEAVSRSKYVTSPPNIVESPPSSIQVMASNQKPNTIIQPVGDIYVQKCTDNALKQDITGFALKDVLSEVEMMSGIIRDPDLAELHSVGPHQDLKDTFYELQPKALPYNSETELPSQQHCSVEGKKPTETYYMEGYGVGDICSPRQGIFDSDRKISTKDQKKSAGTDIETTYLSVSASPSKLRYTPVIKRDHLLKETVQSLDATSTKVSTGEEVILSHPVIGTHLTFTGEEAPTIIDAEYLACPREQGKQSHIEMIGEIPDEIQPMTSQSQNQGETKICLNTTDQNQDSDINARLQLPILSDVGSLNLKPDGTQKQAPLGQLIQNSSTITSVVLKSLEEENLSTNLGNRTKENKEGPLITLSQQESASTEYTPYLTSDKLLYPAMVWEEKEHTSKLHEHPTACVSDPQLVASEMDKCDPKTSTEAGFQWWSDATGGNADMVELPGILGETKTVKFSVTPVDGSITDQNQLLGWKNKDHSNEIPEPPPKGYINDLPALEIPDSLLPVSPAKCSTMEVSQDEYRANTPHREGKHVGKTSRQPMSPLCQDLYCETETKSLGGYPFSKSEPLQTPTAISSSQSLQSQSSFSPVVEKEMPVFALAAHDVEQNKGPKITICAEDKTKMCMDTQIPVEELETEEHSSGKDSCEDTSEKLCKGQLRGSTGTDTSSPYIKTPSDTLDENFYDTSNITPAQTPCVVGIQSCVMKGATELLSHEDLPEDIKHNEHVSERPSVVPQTEKLKPSKPSNVSSAAVGETSSKFDAASKNLVAKQTQIIKTQPDAQMLATESIADHSMQNVLKLDGPLESGKKRKPTQENEINFQTSSTLSVSEAAERTEGPLILAGPECNHNKQEARDDAQIIHFEEVSAVGTLSQDGIKGLRTAQIEQFNIPNVLLSELTLTCINMGSSEETLDIQQHRVHQEIHPQVKHPEMVCEGILNISTGGIEVTDYSFKDLQNDDVRNPMDGDVLVGSNKETDTIYVPESDSSTGAMHEESNRMTDSNSLKIQKFTSSVQQATFDKPGSSLEGQNNVVISEVLGSASVELGEVAHELDRASDDLIHATSKEEMESKAPGFALNELEIATETPDAPYEDKGKKRERTSPRPQLTNKENTCDVSGFVLKEREITSREQYFTPKNSDITPVEPSLTGKVIEKPLSDSGLTPKETSIISDEPCLNPKETAISEEPCCTPKETEILSDEPYHIPKEPKIPSDEPCLTPKETEILSDDDEPYRTPKETEIVSENSYPTPVELTPDDQIVALLETNFTAKEPVPAPKDTKLTHEKRHIEETEMTRKETNLASDELCSNIKKSSSTTEQPISALKGLEFAIKEKKLTSVDTDPQAFKSARETEKTSSAHGDLSPAHEKLVSPHAELASWSPFTRNPTFPSSDSYSFTQKLRSVLHSDRTLTKKAVAPTSPEPQARPSTLKLFAEGAALERSSDSEEAFETPESTTPVKSAPPVPVPLLPEVQEQEPQEQQQQQPPPPQEQVEPKPQEPQSNQEGEEIPQPLLLSEDIVVFDEDKPIASSGTYNLDFASVEPVDPLSSSSEVPARIRRKSTDSVPVSRTTLSRSLSLQAADFQGEDLIGSHGGSDSACSTLRRAKKPRPASLKKKPTGAKKQSEAPGTKDTQQAVTGESQEVEVDRGLQAYPGDSLALPQIETELPLVEAQQISTFSPIEVSSVDPQEVSVGGISLSDPPVPCPPQATEKELLSLLARQGPEVTPSDTGGTENPGVIGQAVRLEFDYSEEAHEGHPHPRKGKKPSGKMPLRKPKAKKAVEKPEPPGSPSPIPAESADIPISKGSYTYNMDMWDDPNFNPFSSSGRMPESSSANQEPPELFKPVSHRAESPAKSPASFEIPTSGSEQNSGEGNKPTKKKKTPLKTDTFRVKKSPKRSPVNENGSEELMCLSTPDTPPVITSEDHATDEEKLASSVSSQKWTCMAVDLEPEKHDYPQPSDLTSFVIEDQFHSSTDDIEYGNTYSMEYMEKTGTCSPLRDLPQTQSLYLMFEASQESPGKSPAKFSETSTPGTGSSFDTMEPALFSGQLPFPRSPPIMQDTIRQPLERPRQREEDPGGMGSGKMELGSPEDVYIAAETLLSRISHQAALCDQLNYLEPDLAEKNPQAFAQKLQEELEFAAMRIEALTLARHISQTSQCSLHTERDTLDAMSHSALYSRAVAMETASGGILLPYQQPDIDTALQLAREEITAKEREVTQWKEKYEGSRCEVVEMRKIVAEYEKTIAQMIEDEQREKSLSHHMVQQLILEKEQALSDLNSVEKSLADLFRRYEKMKEVLEGFRKNEEVLKKCAQEYLARVKKEEQRYHALKIHAEEKLDRANADIAQVRSRSQQEQAAYQASLRKEQLRVDALERTLEQKNKEIEELTKICDELISKMGKS